MALFPGQINPLFSSERSRDHAYRGNQGKTYLHVDVPSPGFGSATPAPWLRVVSDSTRMDATAYGPAGTEGCLLGQSQSAKPARLILSSVSIPVLYRHECPPSAVKA